MWVTVLCVYTNDTRKQRREDGKCKKKNKITNNELDIALEIHRARVTTCEWEGDYCIESPAQKYQVLDPDGALVLLNLCARCLHDEDGNE